MNTIPQLIVGIVIIIITLLLLAYLICGMYADHKGAPYVPTFKSKMKDIERALRWVISNKPHHKTSTNPRLIELGSGSGKIVFSANKIGYTATGVEINPFLVFYSRLMARLTKQSVDFIRANLFSLDLSNYDVVFTYLLTPTMRKLETKLDNELPAKAYVISEVFELPHWKPIKKFGKIYVYHKK
jgi:hypothetical protein